jgi:hAT family C-terminal dimerisation region
MTLLLTINLKENENRYPPVYALAMDVLPIPASAVPCERVFSSAKETMKLRRNRISDHLMEALQILKFSIRKGTGINFTAGWKLEDELKELELKTQMESPEDIQLFIKDLVDRAKE